MGPFLRSCAVALMVAAGVGSAGCGSRYEPRLIDIDNTAIEQLNAEDALDVAYSAAFSGPGAPEEKRQRGMDAVERVSAQVRRDLATLYYPVDLNSARSIRDDRALQQQIRTFEQRLVDFAAIPEGGDRARLLAVSGQLTWFEFNTLHRLASQVQFFPVIGDSAASGRAPHIRYSESHDVAFVSAGGTWVREDGAIDRPLNWSRVECWRHLETCTVWDFSVGEPWISNPQSITWFGPSPAEPVDFSWFQVGISTRTLGIAQWSSTQVVARGDPGPCGEDSLTLSPSSGLVRLVLHTCDESDRTRREVHDLRGSSPVIADHWDRVLGDIERFHGPLAELLYRRPHVGTR